MKGTYVRLFSPTGSLVSGQKVDSNNSVDISKLSAGIYFIVTNKNHKKFTTKIIKK